MPEIARVLGYRIYVFTDDHPPAHVHVRSGDGLVRIYLGKGSVKIGSR